MKIISTLVFLFIYTFVGAQEAAPSLAQALQGCCPHVFRSTETPKLNSEAKQTELRKFIIKDFLDNSNISGATVSFISTDKKDTTMYMANDSGILMTNKLGPGNYYDVIVSTVGYKTLIQRIPYKISECTFLLERNFRMNDEIILSTHPLRRSGCPRGYARRVSKKIIRNDSLTEKSVKIYSQLKIFPNPVPKGGILNIATPRSKAALIYRIFSPSGRLLRSGPLDPLKDFNQISLDSRWSSGVYLLQVYENGCVLASGKVITQ